MELRMDKQILIGAEVIGSAILFVDGALWNGALKDHRLLGIVGFVVSAIVVGGMRALVTVRREKLVMVQHQILTSRIAEIIVEDIRHG